MDRLPSGLLKRFCSGSSWSVGLRKILAMKIDQQREPRFRRTVRRLTTETRNMRGYFAARHAWYAWLANGGATTNLFLQGAGTALQSDLMIWLILVLALRERTTSFFYLLSFVILS